MLTSNENSLDKINPHLKKHIKPESFIRDIHIDPLDILSPARLDVVAKVLYIKLIEMGLIELARKKYLRHIEVINNFEEGDGSGKNGPDAFLKQFDELISSFKEQGFDASVSVLPVDVNQNLIDGAHRLACAIHFQKKIVVRQFDIKKKHLLNYDYFDNTLGYTDELIYEYCELTQDCLGLLIWPKGHELKKRIIDKIRAKCELVYVKEYALDENGIYNLVVHTYMDEPWVKDLNSGYRGAKSKFSSVYKKNADLTHVIVEGISSGELNKLKLEIRDDLKVSNESIHSFDTYEELKRVNQVLLNSNSRSMLQKVKIANFSPEFNKIFCLLQENINFKNDGVVVTSSFLLGMLSMRDPDDIDYLSLDEGIVSDGFFNEHDSQLKFYDKSKKNYIYNPESFFYFLGFKFISIDELLMFKKKRNEAKDRKDIFLLKLSLNKFLNRYLKIKVLVLKNKISYYVGLFRNSHKANLIYNALIGKPSASLAFLFWSLLYKVGIYKKVNYLGFKVFHYPNDSLVLRLNKAKYYEPQVNSYIYEILKKVDKPVLVDIGANIGLTTLTLSSWLTDLKVYCFEPGPHQYKFLEKNIKLNSISGSAYNLAVSDKDGACDFTIHEKNHSSGDGFVDTERVPVSDVIKVYTITLDNFFEDDEPKIDLIKIDTEGAELQVLKGMQRILKLSKPVVVFEFWPANAVKFSLTLLDFIEFFNDFGYSIESLKGALVTSDNYSQFSGKDDMFVAKPLS